MARIAGVNIPVNKHTVIGLQAIYGIGPTRAKVICDVAGVDPATKIKDLLEEQLKKDSRCRGRLYRLKAICAGKYP